ncbi:O-methyltransferase COMT-type [Parasponia andersonii]|uniref:O-methyltransferase COMT-type n=1 Tax=Parasponia andersonii TaxID=3476 RepID=A0A2P5CBS7_PARAD|nr:O-methyltransferase COMT-type [Parasponia andersonii]
MDFQETLAQSSLSTKEDEACLNAMNFANSQFLPLVLNAAIKLDLFGIIAKAGPDAQLSTSEIASQLPFTQNSNANPSLLDRMLRHFASHSLLTCSTSASKDGDIQRLYGLTPTSEFFVCNRNPNESSLASLVALHCHVAPLKDNILDGCTNSQFERVHGMPVYKYMDSNPSFSNIFHDAMVNRSTIIMKKVLNVYKGFEGLSSLVDVGGGTGHCLNMIISQYPSILGTNNLDLPHVTENAPSYAGIKHVPGVMFSSIPKADQAIMIKEILHNWSDEHCRKLVKNCYEALPQNGKLIVIEIIMPEKPDSKYGFQVHFGTRQHNVNTTRRKGKNQKRIPSFVL